MFITTSSTQFSSSVIIQTTCPSPPSCSSFTRSVPGNTHIPVQPLSKWCSTSSLPSSFQFRSIPFTQHHPIYFGFRFHSTPTLILPLFISRVQSSGSNNSRCSRQRTMARLGRSWSLWPWTMGYRRSSLGSRSRRSQPRCFRSLKMETFSFSSIPLIAVLPPILTHSSIRFNFPKKIMKTGPRAS